MTLVLRTYTRDADHFVGLGQSLKRANRWTEWACALVINLIILAIMVIPPHGLGERKPGTAIHIEAVETPDRQMRRKLTLPRNTHLARTPTTQTAKTTITTARDLMPQEDANPAKTPLEGASPTTTIDATDRDPSIGDGKGLRKALRSLMGCAAATTLNLTPEEKAKCRDALATAGLTAPSIDKIPEEKRVEYDLESAHQAALHFYQTPTASGTAGRLAPGAIPGNPPAVFCSLGGAPRGVHLTTKFGKFTCGIILPNELRK